jgi:hypothetical protein
MARTLDISAAQAVGEKLVEAIRAQDWAAPESCFADDVQFRALIPPGFREASDRSSATAHLMRWFGDADTIEILESRVEPIEDRTAVTYRLRLHEDRWYVVEQKAFFDVSERWITHMDLLCSGFRPLAEEAE